MSTVGRHLLLVLIVLVILGGVLVAITFSNPEVLKHAQELSVARKLPLWIVGLFAPITFLFGRFGEWLHGLGGNSEERAAIEKRNNDVEVELGKLKKDVDELNERRREELRLQADRIAGLEQRLASLRDQLTAVDSDIARLRRTPPEEFVKDKTREDLLKDMRNDPSYVP